MKTYLVESDGEVVGLYRLFSNAKFMSRQYPKAVITMMRGDYFGEGFHMYKLERIEGKTKYRYIFRRGVQ